MDPKDLIKQRYEYGKIIQYLRKIGCNFEKIKNNGFGKAKITFFDTKNANKCLEISRKEINKTIDFYIPNRVKRCRGIISDWDRDIPLHELAEAIDDNRRIIRLDRMRRRRYNIRDTKMESVMSHLIMITREGNSLPNKVSLYMVMLLTLELDLSLNLLDNAFCLDTAT